MSKQDGIHRKQCTGYMTYGQKSNFHIIVVP